MAVMKLSVELAAYNGERYIREQLASLAAQTRPADEVILFDDGTRVARQDVIDLVLI